VSPWSLSNLTLQVLPSSAPTMKWPEMEGLQEVKNPTFKQPKNEQTLKIYATFLCALILVVVVARRLQAAWDKNPTPHDRRDAYLQAFRYVSPHR